MTHLIDQIATWIQDLIDAIGYPGIVIVMAIENIFPPIPSELVLPFAGALSAQGEMNFWFAVAAGTAGSLIGAIVLYAVGYFAREAGVRSLVTRYGKFLFISETDLDRAAEWFERYGELIIFFGRLIPIIRSIISVPAGYTRMNPIRFILYTTLGTTLWNLILTYAGRVMGENWEEILAFMETYQYATLAILILAVVAFFVWRIRQKRRQSAQSRN